MINPDTTRRTLPGKAALRALFVSSLLAAVTPLFAFQFKYGELKGSFDTTVSYGGLYRLQDPSSELYATSSSFNGIPGLQNSGNSDDGNLNFPKGWASQLAKANHDFEVKYRDVGAFVRGYYFYDAQIQDNWRGRTPLPGDAVDRVGRGAEWLDMYAFGKFELANKPVDIRFGRQVLSLGESTFIPNGINIVNPVDLSKLRVPGAELKEAFLPVNMLKASIGITQNFTIEPYWLLEFRRNEVEPVGSYFSTNDLVARGGQKVMLGFGSQSDLGTLGAIPRETNREGGNFNQGGISARWLATELNDTEFGFYYARYHSRSPVISARTPTTAINSNLTSPLTAVFMKAGMPADAAAAQAAGLFQLIVLSQTNPGALTPANLATLSASTAAINGAKSIALLSSAATGRYFCEYPEDINMGGISFNTNLARTGISWQGEVSLKQGVPLQVDDVELLFATLGSISNVFDKQNQIGSYLGQLNTEITGFRRHNVWTAQTTMTKTIGNVLGANQISLVGEVGGLFANLPSKDVLRYDGSATFTGGNAAYMANTGNSAYPTTPSGAFADRFSWGYQLAARADYSNVFAGVNLQPTLAFTHDVAGNSPLPLGNFIKNRKSITLGAEFTYLNRWALDLRYVNFFGAGRYNLLADRDYVSATLKFSF
jgi:hypothetical protein